MCFFLANAPIACGNLYLARRSLLLTIIAFGRERVPLPHCRVSDWQCFTCAHLTWGQIIMIMKLPGDFIHTCVLLAIWADGSRPILHSSQYFCWASIPSPFHPFHGCLLMLLMLSLTQYQTLGKEMLRHHPFLEMLREYQGSHSQKSPSYNMVGTSNGMRD